MRQLQNVIQNVVVLHNAKMVELHHLPHPLNSGMSSETAAAPETSMPQVEAAPAAVEKIQPLAVTEREAIESAIAYCIGNIPKAAELLDVSPYTIYRKNVGWQE
ncbi:helix-turn-helix domain-containing protein [uncultured Alteromonas sp.]|uniref:helix-turn-helix domain-containing protein n=1 Tax=uncultured Alteromonas sp. TaxID=179113 RepID=UPI0025F76895|nr:helix-turn-helix domain-containing protein [uncultured Alteromonas sp.]